MLPWIIVVDTSRAGTTSAKRELRSPDGLPP